MKKKTAAAMAAITREINALVDSPPPNIPLEVISIRIRQRKTRVKKHAIRSAIGERS